MGPPESHSHFVIIILLRIITVSMDFVRTFVCVPKAIVETQVGTLCNLLEDDVVKVIDSTASSRWWSECRTEKNITQCDAPDPPVSRPKGRRVSLIEKISEVYETNIEALGHESKHPTHETSSGPRQVIDHAQFRLLLEKDLYISKDAEIQPSIKPHQAAPKMKSEKPASGPTQHSRNNTEAFARGFKQRYALLADNSRKAAELQQARLVKMQTESYIQRLGAQSAPDSKLMISGAGRRARRPHAAD
jgi:hypothetical protein